MTSPAIPDPAEVLTPRQVSRILGRCYDTVLTYIDDGDLRAVRRRGRFYIRRQWVDDFLNADDAESA
jgi:excisionase family DNA binding protein